MQFEPLLSFVVLNEKVSATYNSAAWRDFSINISFLGVISLGRVIAP